MENIYALGINVIVNAKCVEIKKDGVVIERDGKLEEIKADHVVMSVGAKPANYNEIESYCEEKGIPYYVIGHAVRARRAFNAINEAVDVAMKI